MIQSVLVLYIVIGNSETAPAIIDERPEIGLFVMPNVITQRNEWVLAYGTDKIRGKDATKIRFKQGMLTLDGIGTINERADFKIGGGKVLQAGTRFRLNNTAALKIALNEMEVDFAGRLVYVVEYTWNEPVYDWEIGNAEIEINPLFAGRIDAPRWGESVVEFQALPTFEAQRTSNLAIDDLPVSFGQLGSGTLKKHGETQYLTLDYFTDNRADNNQNVYTLIGFRRFRLYVNGAVLDNQQFCFYKVKIPGIKHPSFHELEPYYALDEDSSNLALIKRRILVRAEFYGIKEGNFFVSLTGGNNNSGDVPILRETWNGQQVCLIPNAQALPSSLMAIVDSGEENNPAMANAGMEFWNNYADNEILMITDRPILPIAPSEPLQGNVQFTIARADVVLQSDGWANTTLAKTVLPDRYRQLKYIKEGRLVNLSVYGRYGIFPDAMHTMRDPFNPHIGAENYHYHYRDVEYLDVPTTPHVKKIALFLNESFFKAETVLSYYNQLITNPQILRDSDLLRWDRENLRGYKGTRFASGARAGQRAGVYSSTSTANPTITPVGTLTINEDYMGLQYNLDANHQANINYLVGLYAVLPPMPEGLEFDRAYFMPFVRAAFSESSTRNNNTARIIAREFLSNEQIRRVVDFDVRLMYTPAVEFSPTTYVAERGGILNTLGGSQQLYPAKKRVATQSDSGVYDAFLQDDIALIHQSQQTNHPSGDIWTGYRTIPLDLDFDPKMQRDIAIIFGPVNPQLANYQSQNGNGGVSCRISWIVAHVLFETVVDLETLIGLVDGRMYNNTWGGRRINTGLISNPLDIIEMCARLSNWSETRRAGVSLFDRWGKEYAPTGYTELIDTNSFDGDALKAQRNITISGQVIKPDDAGNFKLMKSLCRDFYIGLKNRLPVNYSKNGEPRKAWMGEITMPHESVFSLETPEDADTVPVIGLRELLDPVEVREPSVYDIYCEPILRYGYIDGIGYMQEMAVTNINMPEWKPEYTRGLSTVRRGHASVPSDSQYTWELCKNIFNKYQAFGDMPTDLTEQHWIGDNGVGFGTFSPSYENALWKLRKILRWMLYPRTTIRVGWNVGRTWEVGTHVRIAVPHIKESIPFLCVVESIAKTRYGQMPNVQCELIILENINVEWEPLDIEGFFAIDQTYFNEPGGNVALRWMVHNAEKVTINRITMPHAGTLTFFQDRTMTHELMAWAGRKRGALEIVRHVFGNVASPETLGRIWGVLRREYRTDIGSAGSDTLYPALPIPHGTIGRHIPFNAGVFTDDRLYSVLSLPYGEKSEHVPFNTGVFADDRLYSALSLPYGEKSGYAAFNAGVFTDDRLYSALSLPYGEKNGYAAFDAGVFADDRLYSALSLPYGEKNGYAAFDAGVFTDDRLYSALPLPVGDISSEERNNAGVFQDSIYNKLYLPSGIKNH